jgi:hypothetical protein
MDFESMIADTDAHIFAIDYYRAIIIIELVIVIIELSLLSKSRCISSFCRKRKGTENYQKKPPLPTQKIITLVRKMAYGNVLYGKQRWKVALLFDLFPYLRAVSSSQGYQVDVELLFLHLTLPW